MSSRRNKRWQCIPGEIKRRSENEYELRRQFDVEKIGYEHDNEKTQIIPGRRFRFDFVFTQAEKVCLEVQGGIGTRNTNAIGHKSGAGFSRDCEKSFLAQLEGWLVITVTPKQVFDGTAVKWVSKAINKRE